MASSSNSSDEILKPFKLQISTLERVRDILTNQMYQGLETEKHQASVKMLPSFVQKLPSGNESGGYLALDMGGTNFRVLLILFNDGECTMDSKIFSLPDDVKNSEADKLFSYISECLEEFLKSRQMLSLPSPLPLGFTFSFPVKQTALASGTLIHWTKEIYCKGVVGEDVVQLLEKAFEKRNLPVKCVALVNDTVGCQMSCGFGDQNTYIAVIIGTGSNACYMEKLENIHKLKQDNFSSISDEMIINVEFGGFGSDGSISFVRTDVDNDIDKDAKDKGGQIFEKMISGKYMGEMVRRIIVKHMEKKLLFSTNHSNFTLLRTPHSFKTEFISQIESNPENIIKKTKEILKSLGVEGVLDSECHVIYRICQIISERSASLAAAGVSALVNKVNRPFVTIGYDGSVCKFHPHYMNHLEKLIQVLIKPNIQFKLKLSEDGSGKGAALIAACAGCS